MATGVKETEIVEEVKQVVELDETVAELPVNELEDAENDKTSDVLKVVAKTAIGATIGLAGGLALVTIAAVAEGAILSIAVFTKVLGIAGGAAGLAHGASSVQQEKKKRRINSADKNSKLLR